MSSAESIIDCPHAPPCPGCPLIRRPYDEQLRQKAENVEAAKARYAELAGTPVDGVRAADPVTAYRQRAKLVVDGTRIGLFARGTHDVVDIPECRVLDPVLSRVAAGLRRSLPLSVQLRAVDLQRVPEGALVTLVVPAGTDGARAREEAARLLAALPDAVGVAVSVRDEGSHQVLGRAPVPEAGIARAEGRVLPNGPFHYVVAGGFTQAHRGQQRALFDAVLDALSRTNALRGARVLELYAGSGALSLCLAAQGANVLSAESYAPAAELCREAAAAQGLTVTTRIADASDVARELARAGERFDVVIVNPPRRGLSPSVRADLALLAPRLVLYVSCEPATLSRDLADLTRRGLATRSLSPYDMMPLTEEVETLAVLEPGGSVLPDVLHADERLIAVVKAPHEPTTPQGEHESSLLARVRRLDGAAEAVPVHRLDLGTSGVCLFARRPEHVAVIARALKEGEKEYIALVRGIARPKGSIRRTLVEQGHHRAARTRYVRRRVAHSHSLISAFPEEGRKHQIRRHLASIGHPLVGDERYGDERTNRHFSMRYFLDRPFLHCARIVLAFDGGALELSAPLAPDLAMVLEALDG